MIHASFYNEEGRIVQLGTLLDAAECTATAQASSSLVGWVSGTHSPDLFYAEAGEVRQRPSTPLPQEYLVAANFDWEVGTMPVGTEVTVDGEPLGVIDDGDLVLSFAVPGVWTVHVNPPFPWVPATCEVSVT